MFSTSKRKTYLRFALSTRVGRILNRTRGEKSKNTRTPIRVAANAEINVIISFGSTGMRTSSVAYRITSNVAVHPAEGRREAPLPRIGCNGRSERLCKLLALCNHGVPCALGQGGTTSIQVI